MKCVDRRSTVEERRRRFSLKSGYVVQTYILLLCPFLIIHQYIYGEFIQIVVLEVVAELSIAGFLIRF